MRCVISKRDHLRQKMPSAEISQIQTRKQAHYKKALHTPQSTIHMDQKDAIKAARVFFNPYF